MGVYSSSKIYTAPETQGDSDVIFCLVTMAAVFAAILSVKRREIFVSDLHTQSLTQILFTKLKIHK